MPPTLTRAPLRVKHAVRNQFPLRPSMRLHPNLASLRMVLPKEPARHLRHGILHMAVHTLSGVRHRFPPVSSGTSFRAHLRRQAILLLKGHTTDPGVPTLPQCVSLRPPPIPTLHLPTPHPPPQ